MQYDFIFKIVMIGESSIGKSTIMRKLIHNYFDDSVHPTIGVDFGTKNLTIKNCDQNVKFQIWDTGGREEFRSIIKSYYNKTIGVIAVFDVSNPHSFYKLEEQIHDIRNMNRGHINYVLIGNKADLKNKLFIDKNLIEDFCYKYNCQYFEISAKTNIDVSEPFQHLANTIYEAYSKNPCTLAKNPGITVYNDGSVYESLNDKKSSCNCCTIS